MRTHPQADYAAGDDWELRGTLLDQNGVPYDLSGNQIIEWVLLDHDLMPVTNGTGITISILDAAAGRCAILVAKTTTKDIDPGMHSDRLRITIGGVRSTLWGGPIYVLSDPWKTTGG